MKQVSNVTCVAVGGRGILMTGAPGKGKSSLALALIDRGAILVGDDGIGFVEHLGRAWAHPPANIAALLEIRGVGIVDLPVTSAPLCLALSLDDFPDRLPEPEPWLIGATVLPRLHFKVGDALQAIRAEYALRLHGLPVPDAIV